MWTHRQQRNAIGRVVTCHLTEGERYYLRLLLMNIRAPKSYEDLLTFNGEYCSTFRESVEKRGLILCDNNLIECMSEATSYQMPSSLRYLFDVLLAYCYPNNPEELWIKIENPMSEDFNKYPGLFSREISSKVLNHINDILYLMGRDINEFELISEIIKASALDLLVKDLMETNILFGGKVIVSSGDFRQTLSVVRGGKKEDFLQAYFVLKFETNLKSCKCLRIGEQK